MNARSDPREETYDVVVIGSGVAGLSSGAMLAKAGRKVLVVEKQDGPGGYARPFRRGPYLFDPAVHVTGQGREGELYDSVFRHLGVRDHVRFLPVNHFYTALFPDFRFDAPVGFDEFIEAHARAFPAKAEMIRDFVAMSFQVNRQAHLLPPRLSLKDLDEVAAKNPLLFRYIKATVADVMDEHLDDPHLKAVLFSVWPYVGLPPSRASYLTYTQILSSQIDGVYYPEGSFQVFVDALVTGLEQNGGELVVNNGATRIVLVDGRAAGVVLEGGQEIRAHAIISNADARTTFEEMVGSDQLPSGFVRRLRRMEPASSAFVVYGVTTLDLEAMGAAHEMFSYRHWDHDESYREAMDLHPSGLVIQVPTLVDPSISRPGEHIISAYSLAPYDIGRSWEQEKPRYLDAFISEMEVVFPGFRDSLVLAEAATPPALERYTSNTHGAIYGWAYTTDQSGSKRLSHVSPVPGLFLAGHWTQPGAACLRVFLSGVHTSDIVLQEAAMRGDIPVFEAPDLPPAF